MKTRRNKFKLISLSLAATVLLLLLSAYGYLALRNYNAYRNAIHADAKLIIKIDADRIYGTLALDYLSNLSHYRGGNVKSIESGLDIPAQVFVYTLKSKSAHTYFCAMPVRDTMLLKSFLRKKLGITGFKKSKEYIIGKSADGKLTVAFNGRIMAAGYSMRGEYVEDIIADLVNRTNMLSDKDYKIVRLKASGSHLAYVFDDYTGTGDFKDGKLHIEGDFNFPGFMVDGKTFTHRVFNKDAIVKMWLNAKPSLNKQFGKIEVKNYQLYPDSLLKYCDSYFDVEMGKPVSQAERVITYVYNDDFEKEEKVTQRMVKVPGINSVVEGKATGLYNYLVGADLVNGVVVRKDFFPLYQLYVQRREKELMVSTNQHVAIDEARESTPYFFYLYADFDQLKSQGQFPVFEKYIRPLSRLVVKAMPESNVGIEHLGSAEQPKNADDTGDAELNKGANRTKKNHFEIDLYFKIKDVNALGQFR